MVRTVKDRRRAKPSKGGERARSARKASLPKNKLGELLRSDQGDKIEGQILHHITLAQDLLEKLTFEKVGLLKPKRDVSIILLNLEAAWATMWFANGS